MPPPRPCPSGRLGGRVAAPRCCAAHALTQPPPAKGLCASTRCPAETATLIKIRVFPAGYHTYVSRIYFRRTCSGPKYAILGIRDYL